MYYFLGLIGFRKSIRPIAPFITTIQVKTRQNCSQNSVELILRAQLLQMVGGMVVTGSSVSHYMEDPSSCSVDPANMKLAIAMYFSYFVLFAVLFVNLYINPSKKKIQTGCPDIASSCNVTDGSGFFHGSNAKEDEKKEPKKTK